MSKVTGQGGKSEDWNDRIENIAYTHSSRLTIYHQFRLTKLFTFLHALAICMEYMKTASKFTVTITAVITLPPPPENHKETAFFQDH